ncbi:CvpA family protein [Alienimonas sp. DA493]|uniref:CvpA family protein n=1 Tax=Alienimonas sp. DA493 TaxID=3373605 RepID=UPI003754671F
MIDLILLALWGGVTYFVANEGALGAVTTFFCVVLSGLLAMNFFEPLAEAIGGSDFLRERADVICLLGLFAAFVTGMRLACEQIAPRMLELPAAAYHALRWVFGAATGYVTMAVILVALHVSPLPRTFLGFAPERGFAATSPGGNLFDVDAPDRRWLAFTRYVSLNPLKKGGRNQLVDGNGTLLNTLSGFDNRTGYAWDAVTSDGSHAATKSMPSFVIRYADRRANGAGAAPVVVAAPAAPQRPRGPAF